MRCSPPSQPHGEEAKSHLDYLIGGKQISQTWAAMIVADEAVPPEPGSLKGTAFFGETQEEAEEQAKRCLRGHRHHAALRALAAKWLKIIFVLWGRQVPYREEYHLAMMARQQLHQAA